MVVPDPNQPSPLPESREDGQPVAANQGEPILLTPQRGVDHGHAPFTVAADHTDADAATHLTARRPRRRAVATVLAGVVTLVVLAGGGAVAAKLWYGSTGALPEGPVPASTATFVRINLSPGYGQRVKMLALRKKFPKGGSGAGNGGSSQLDTYKQSLVTGLDLGLSFDDVKGWIGDRAGVGAWADGQGRPVMLATFASGDDGAARKALRAAGDRAGSEHLGFVVSGGYALLAKADKGAQAAADEAVRATGKASLADDGAFRADLATVMPGLTKLTGVVVAGAQAVGNGIEVRSRSIGVARPAGATINAMGALDAMPGLAALDPTAALGAGPGGGPTDPATGPVGPLQPSFGPDGSFPTAPTDPTGGIAQQEAFGKAAHTILTALGAAKNIGVAMTGVPAKNQALPPMILTVGMGDDPVATTLAGNLNTVATSDGLGAPAAPTSGAYIDVRKLQATLGASTATITTFGPVKAIGITTAHSGNDGLTLIRIIIR
jgi:hypothetical protein